jgi:prepilin signal peptidase PulO-like enzyme (type II secretory pathway)
MIMLMEIIFIYALLAVLGLLFGSFGGATVWRLRARQLLYEKNAGEKVDAKEYKILKPLTKASFATDRSRCLHCGHKLAWFDLLPLGSWLSTQGKCRYCGVFIGWFEPVIELGMATLFIASYAFWPLPLALPYEIIQFLLWLVACVLLVILFAYDLRWYFLPNRIMFPLIGIAVLSAIITLSSSANFFEGLMSLGLAAVILSGLYLVLWLISKGTWIGFGDVKLGLALALLLGEWYLAFIAFFAANIIGCLIVLPAMLRGKVTRKTHVAFGPLLIAGGVVAMLWGRDIVNWYFMAFV